MGYDGSFILQVWCGAVRWTGVATERSEDWWTQAAETTQNMQTFVCEIRSSAAAEAKKCRCQSRSKTADSWLFIADEDNHLGNDVEANNIRWSRHDMTTADVTIHSEWPPSQLASAWGTTAPNSFPDILHSLPVLNMTLSCIPIDFDFS